MSTITAEPSGADALDVAMSKACIHSWDQSQFTSGDCDAVPPMFSMAFEAGYRAALSASQEAPAAQGEPAQYPLTDEHKAILKECRNQAMRWTLEARIPEAGAFGGIAQDLDYLCGQLGIKND